MDARSGAFGHHLQCCVAGEEQKVSRHPGFYPLVSEAKGCADPAFQMSLVVLQGLEIESSVRLKHSAVMRRF